MKLKLFLTLVLFCNVFFINATTNSVSKTNNSNEEVLVNEIICSVSSISFCSGLSVTVTFTATGTYASGNIFTAQLSNASGSFASPVNIGTKTDIVSGTISATIPSNTTYGTGYRIRVIASNPSIIGTDNGVNITVYQKITPDFTTFPPFCSGSTMPVLPTTSVNGIIGTWSPSTISNMITATYTFTPTIGQCATTTTLTITVNPKVTPTFTPIAPICSGATITPLPTTSNEGITGTWSPALSNASSTTYTFTPTTGQCSATTRLTITVNQKVTPTFSAIAPICQGATPPVLPTTSINGITGTWLPSAISNSATGVYFFTPDSGQCATTITLAVTVNPLPTANASPNNLSICSGTTTNINLSSNQPGTTFNWTAVQTGVAGALAGSGTAIKQKLFTLGLISGTVEYIITPTANGCVGIPITATVNVNPTPEGYTLPKRTICSGESTNIKFASSFIGTQFSWTVTQLGATGAIAGTGSTINDILLTGTTAGKAVYTITSLLNGCQGNSFETTVTVNPLPILEPMPDVTACSSYTLPELLKGSYYSGVAGTGNRIAPGTVITTSTLLSVFFNDGFCSASYPLSITIIPETKPEIVTENDTHDLYVDNATVVQPLLLDSQFSEEYSFQWYENGILIDGATNSTYLVNTVSQNANPRNFTVTAIKGICESASSIFEVNQTPVPAPSGNRFQSFTQGQTLADLIVIGSNIQWYADETANRKASSPLPLNTLLVNGTTYYASQTINGYESPSRLAVTVQVALGNHSFTLKDLQVSPNPILDVLNIKSKEIVKNITVYNALGQEVSHKEGNGLEFKLDLSHLVSGNYFVKVVSENKQKVLKVVKK